MITILKTINFLGQTICQWSGQFQDTWEQYLLTCDTILASNV